jgi:uncharacterized protein (UPF0332 family)
MISTDKVLFSLQMAEESFQEVQLLLKDGKTRSLLNSLYNVYYYGMEAILLNQDISCRKHDEVKQTFIEKFLRTGLLPRSWEKEIEAVFKMKDENEKGVLPAAKEVHRLIQTGKTFLKSVKGNLLV